MTRPGVLERIMELVLRGCAGLSILVTLAILAVLVFETAQFFREVPPAAFLFGTVWTPLSAQQSFGVLPLVAGTALVSAVALAIALPAGLLTAIYLSEYAPFAVRRVVKPALGVLAGVPTVVYGYFALLFVTPLLQQVIPGLAAFNALGPGIVMGIMILPMVSSLSEDALHGVPGTLREAAHALGSSRAQTTLRVVLPAAGSGVASAALLAVSRAIGEAMIVTIAAGQQPRLTANPLVPIETMTANIVNLGLSDVPTGTLEHHTIFAVGLLLFAGTFALNLVSHWLRTRLRGAYP